MHANDPLCLYALALRKARSLTRQELADAAGASAVTLRNIEQGRAIAIRSLAEVYFSLKGKLALTDPEKHQLIAYWIQRHVPELTLSGITPALHSVKASATATHSARSAAYTAALDHLPAQDSAALETLTKIATTKKAAPVFAVLRPLLALFR